MGTMFRIVLWAPDVEAARAAFRAAFAEIRRLDDTLSDYREESELNRFCRAPAGRAVALSPELFEALALSQRLAEKTDGAFDVTLGPLIRLWRRARKEARLPDEQQRAQALAACGWRKLELDRQARTGTLLAPGMRLDLGGVAKGLAADRALGVLRERGLASALVAAGGDVRAGDAPPEQAGWNVGVRGLDASESGLSRVVVLANRAISTSGDAEQFVEIGGVRYSHIVDPQTGLGLRDRLTATVIAPTGARADALATAVSVLGAKRGIEMITSEPESEALVIRAAEGGYEQRETEAFPKGS
jgi:thiamine biosynthesis lipoprotein